MSFKDSFINNKLVDSKKDFKTVTHDDFIEDIAKRLPPHITKAKVEETMRLYCQAILDRLKPGGSMIVKSDSGMMTKYTKVPRQTDDGTEGYFLEGEVLTLGNRKRKKS